MLPLAIARMTYAEYLALEAASETKHEYINGEVFAMAKGTITHGALGMAVGAALSVALRDRPCRVLSSDVRVRSKVTGIATYPDVTVVCQNIEVDDEDKHGVLNATLIGEVLSDSTEAYDRGAKAAHYRRPHYASTSWSHRTSRESRSTAATSAASGSCFPRPVAARPPRSPPAVSRSSSRSTRSIAIRSPGSRAYLPAT